MTPTAADIVSSPAWQDMQERVAIEFFERFKRTPCTDADGQAHLRRMMDAFDEMVDELERMARGE